MSVDAVIKPRTVTTLELAVRRSNHSVRSHPFDVYVRISDLEFMVGSAVMVGVEDVQVGLPHVLQNRFYFTKLKVVLVLIDDKIAQNLLCFCRPSSFVENLWQCTEMLLHLKKINISERVPGQNHFSYEHKRGNLLSCMTLHNINNKNFWRSRATELKRTNRRGMDHRKMYGMD